MADKFSSLAYGMDSPAASLEAIDYSSGDVTLGSVTRGLYVGAYGDLTCVSARGDTVTFVGLLAGVVYPFRISTVLQAGTTAGNLIGLS